MASVKVFGSPATAEVARVLACLVEKEVEFQLIRVDTYKGSKWKPEHLKLQPSGQAITFEDGKTTLGDSRAICRYLSEKYAEQGTNLLGSGMHDWESIEQWLLMEEQRFEPASSELVLTLAYDPSLPFDRSKKKLEKVLDIYEERLKKSPFLAGENFTLADLSHLPNAQQLMKSDKTSSLFTVRENVNQWWKKISGRTSWTKVVEIQKESPRKT